ncbi:regulator of chromosome condensation-like protein, partial [Euroglyphus maynei]
MTKSMDQVAVETTKTAPQPKPIMATTPKPTRSRRRAVMDDVMKKSEPEITAVTKDEPDNNQQLSDTSPESEIEKNDQKSEKSANNSVDEKKIVEVVDKVNEIVAVIESESSSAETNMTDKTESEEPKNKSHAMPKKQVSFEIVDMDDNEEITGDIPVVNIDVEQTIVDDESRSMPSSVESREKPLDLDSTIIVIEEAQSDDSFQQQQQQHTVSESIDANSVATNSNGQSSMVIVNDNDERALKRKTPDSFVISNEEIVQVKKARFELPDFGDLFTMGDQLSKELGPREIHFRGRKTLRSQPAKVRIGAFKIKQVSMGALHTLALTVDGQVLSFGCNDDFVLGRLITREEYTNNLITNDDLDELDVDDDEFEEKLSGRPLPVKELQSKKVVKVSAGDMHSAALCDDGKVYVWGNFKDDSDKVGLFVDCEKSPNNSDYFPQIEIDMKIVDIASGSHHMLLLTDEGSVFTFGDGSKGQLGRIVSTELNSIKTNRDLFLRPQPVSIPEQAKIEHVFASQWNSFALSTDGKLYGWGLNNYFQLGLKNDFISQANSLNSDSLFTLIPTRVPLSFHCRQVSNGQQHSLALDRDGNVYACGSALYGKLGLGEDFLRQCNDDKLISDFKQIPSAMFNDERVIKVDCGDFCSMAITETGRLYCWGQGGLHIGTSADDDLFEPKQIANGPYDECT